MATEGYLVLSFRNFHCIPSCLLCKELTEETASPTQAPPNRREYFSAKRQKMVMLARVQGTFW